MQRRKTDVSTEKPAAPADLPKLAAPARRALDGAGINSIAMLARRTQAEVAALHGMGPNAMKTLKTAMKQAGFSFAKR
jgi:predicted Fe-Mo cluster-binding NifX family protein